MPLAGPMPSSPPASVPGDVSSPTKTSAQVEKQQRGVSNFKGEDSNSQPNPGKGFTRRYFDVGPTDK
eukprot:2896610-Alexandrium_andersonii.AAC.1